MSQGLLERDTHQFFFLIRALVVIIQVLKKMFQFLVYSLTRLCFAKTNFKGFEKVIVIIPLSKIYTP